jgi:hypothetical protein
MFDARKPIVVKLVEPAKEKSNYATRANAFVRWKTRGKLAIVLSLLALVAAIWWRLSPHASRASLNPPPAVAIVHRDEVLRPAPVAIAERSTAPAKGVSGRSGGVSLADQPEGGAESSAGRSPGARSLTADASRSFDADRDLTADEILQKMRAKYATLTSYSDRGQLTRTWDDVGTVYVDVPFRTFFKRKLSYRFEWLGDRDPYRESYWANADGVFVRNQTVLRPFPSLGIIFRASMVDASYHVLQFLAPDALPMSRDFFAPATRLADDWADGVACYHLTGVTPLTQFHRELWIGKDDLLLRQTLTVTNHTYRPSPKPEYKTGRETVRILYLDVMAGVDLPNQLFDPTAVIEGGR